MDILNIILAVSGFVTGGGLIFLITMKSSKRKASAEADEKEIEVLLKKHTILKDVETLNIKWVDELMQKLDEKCTLILGQKELILNLRIEMKDLEEKIKNLEKDLEKIRRCNDGLKRENAEIKENLKHICLEINCKKRIRL